MYQYSFANVDLLLEVPDSTGAYKKLNVKGFPTGENLMSVTRRAPLAGVNFGAYGDMIVNMQRIRAGDLVFPTLVNSPENKVLQDYCNYFQDQADANGAIIFPIRGKIVDNMGSDKVTLTNGVILAVPAFSRGQTLGSNTWVITFEDTNFERGDGQGDQPL